MFKGNSRPHSYNHPVVKQDTMIKNFQLIKQPRKRNVTQYFHDILGRIKRRRESGFQVKQTVIALHMQKIRNIKNKNKIHSTHTHIHHTFASKYTR